MVTLKDLLELLIKTDRLNIDFRVFKCDDNSQAEKYEILILDKWNSHKNQTNYTLVIDTKGNEYPDESDVALDFVSQELEELLVNKYKREEILSRLTPEERRILGY